jgi:hypothetical protein
LSTQYSYFMAASKAYGKRVSVIGWKNMTGGMTNLEMIGLKEPSECAPIAAHGMVSKSPLRTQKKASMSCVVVNVARNSEYHRSRLL